VNGALDTLARKARPSEFAAAAPAEEPAP
jgi:hypothetical protein